MGGQCPPICKTAGSAGSLQSGICGLPGSGINSVRHRPGLGDIDGMAAGDRGDLCPGAFGHVEQHRLVKGIVLGCDYRPAGLGAPGCIGQPGAESGHVDRHLRVTQEGGVFITEIGGKADLELFGLEGAEAVIGNIDDEIGGRREAGTRAAT